MNAHFRIDLSQLQPQLNFGWYSPQLINGCQIYSIYHKFQFVPLYFQKKQSITFIFLYQDSSYLIQQQIQMRNLHLAIAVFVLIFIQQAESANKLIFVQQLFRHGARYPIYPKRGVDMTDYVLDEKKMGQLTTQGKNMHYLLGKQVYKAYWNQLFTDPIYSQTFNNTKFYFKSTDVNRTFESCQSHLMGIFQNLPKLTITNEQTNFSKPLWPGTSAVAGDVFPNAPLFHPVPIHSQKLGTSFNDKGDFLRSYSPENCPQQNVWVKQNQASTFAKMVASDQSFVKTLAQLTKALNRTQKNPVTFEQEGYFYDNYECSTFLGKPTLPIFSDPKYARDLAYIYTIDLYINLFFSDTQIRTTSSGFFQATLANINRAISKRDVQWVIYSAHDTTVGNILAGLNMTNAACIYEAYKKGEEYNKDTCVSAYPGYTANIIFEVYEDNETLIQTFKIRYNGEYRKIPFCDNALECRVEKMQKWYNENIKVQSFAANCGLINEDKVFYKGFAIIEFGVILCFCLYWVIRHLKQTVVLVKPADKKQAEAEIKMLKKELLKEQV